MSWTDERVDLVKKMWAEGLSASVIANALGGGVTRNAVIGKVHRLGLSGRVKAAEAAAPRRARPTRAPSHPLRAATSFVSRGATALAPDLVPEIEELAVLAPARGADVVMPMSERVTIMDLRESMCRWPLGDPGRPDFRFCGARSETGVPYCSHHAALAYQPSLERRRERERGAAVRPQV